MDHHAIDAVFKPKATKLETRADQTTRAAREILATEEADRDAKSARLKTARLVKESQYRETETARPKAVRKSRRRQAK